MKKLLKRINKFIAPLILSVQYADEGFIHGFIHIL